MANLLKTVVIGLLCGIQMMGTDAAHGRRVDEASLVGFLRNYLGGEQDKTTRYSAAPVTLDTAGHETLVYVTGRSWCGSGGCTALLLRPNNKSFAVLDRFTLVRLPIAVLPSRTNGWHDLAMSVEGGGPVPGRMAILRFDGHRYPNNPSMAPKLATDVADGGTKVPLSERGSLLY